MNKIFLCLIIVVFFIGLFFQTSSAQSKVLRIAPKTGIWKVVGKDQVGWKGFLKLVKKRHYKSVTLYNGHFYWRSLDGEIIGYEYITATFNRHFGRLKLKGYALKNLRGELAKGNYLAFVTQKGRKIIKGSWDGVDEIGIWSARWIKN
jgi:hypothetical protein